MKILQKFFLISFCMAICTSMGCTKGSSTQQDYVKSVDSVMGIIKEVRDGEYLISVDNSRNYLIADKCGTDYKRGDSVKVDYAGAFHYNNNNKSRLDEDYAMYIYADEYMEISLWDNDFTFLGSMDNRGYSVEDDDDSFDRSYIFIPLRTEDEGKAYKILRNDRPSFTGYESQINCEEGFESGLYTSQSLFKITYDPETMLVTNVENARDGETGQQ